MPLEPDGDDATLQSVSATVTPPTSIVWSTYQAVNGQGFGSWRGPLEPAWAIQPVGGNQLPQDTLSALFVIGTLQTEVPGVYRVSNIQAHYDSGPRSRTAESKFVVCILVTPPGATFDSLKAANDPLWVQFQDCDPSRRT